MNSFEQGDVVELKSGGPQMTVLDTYDNGWVKTTWFVDNKLDSAEFPAGSLKAV